MCLDEIWCAVHLVSSVDGQSTRPHRAALRASRCCWQGQSRRPRLLALQMRLWHRCRGVWRESASQAHRELRVPECRGNHRSELGSWSRRTRQAVLRVPVMDRDAVAVQQPQRQELPALRRPRDQGLRALGVVRELHRRPGQAAWSGSFDRTSRQRQGLRAGQLPVGRSYGPGKQPKIESTTHSRRSDEDGRGVGRGCRHSSVHHRSADRSAWLVDRSSADDASADQVPASLSGGD